MVRISWHALQESGDAPPTVALPTQSRQNQCQRAVVVRCRPAFFLASLPELFGKIQIGLGNFALAGAADMSFQRLPGLVEQFLQLRRGIPAHALTDVVDCKLDDFAAPL